MDNFFFKFKEFIPLYYAYHSSKNYISYHIIYSIGLASIISATFFVGAVPTRIFGHDIFFLLDNGWRIVNGQFPHVDFSSAWGPVTFLITGLGIYISEGNVEGVGYGSGVFGLIIGVWSYILCGKHLKPTLRIILCLYLVCLAVAPYPLGWNFQKSSHAMVYNRYGYTLLAMAIIDLFCYQKKFTSARKLIAIGLSSGIAIALTFFLKISYFGAAIFFVFFSLYLKNFCRFYVLGLFLGITIIASLLLFFLNFDIISLFNDLQTAAGSRANSISSYATSKKIINNIPIFLFITLLAFKAQKLEPENTEWSKPKILYIGLLVFLVDMLIVISNQQFLNLPLSVVFTLLVVNRAVLLPNNNYGPDRKLEYCTTYNQSIVGPGLLFFIVFWTLDIAGLSYGVLQKYHISDFQGISSFSEPRLSSLVLFDNNDDPRANGHFYVEYVNDGLQLIKKNSSPNQTILAVDMFNPFSYSLGRRPAKGGIAAAAYNYTISDKYHPSDDKFFGSADLVIIPKMPSTHISFYEGFYRIYEFSIKRKFKFTAESDHWLLYRRR